MAKSKYQNFQEYSENDQNYFTRVLLGDLHKPQSKITFQDGSTYHVTKSGSRYWEKYGQLHREDGPAGVWSEHHPGSYYLFSVGFPNREAHQIGVQRLNLLREKTNQGIEDQVNQIVQSRNWEARQALWQSILCSEGDPAAMLARLDQLSDHYQAMNKMTEEFVSGQR